MVHVTLLVIIFVWWVPHTYNPHLSQVCVACFDFLPRPALLQIQQRGLPSPAAIASFRTSLLSSLSSSEVSDSMARTCSIAIA